MSSPRTIQNIIKNIEMNNISIHTALDENWLQALFYHRCYNAAKVLAKCLQLPLKPIIINYIEDKKQTLKFCNCPTDIHQIDSCDILDDADVEHLIKQACNVRCVSLMFNLTSESEIVTRTVNRACINGNLPLVSELLMLFGDAVLLQITLFFDVCAYGQLDVAKLIHDRVNHPKHILDTALWRNAYSSRCESDIMGWLISIGASVPINIFMYVNNLTTAKWLLNHFSSAKGEIAQLRDIHRGSIMDIAILNDRYDLALWMADEFDVQIVNKSIINNIDDYIIHALDMNKHEFVTKLFNQLSYKIEYFKVHHLMLTAVDVSNGSLCQWFIEQYNLNPTDYGLDESFGMLGPKRAL